MASAVSDAAPIPLQVDIDYVDAAHDACVAWLKGQYASLIPAATAAARDTSHAKENNTGSTGKTESKKPQLGRSVLQRLENDVTACNALRWRVFAFPSHPTKPLNSNYRNEPSKKDEPSALTAQVHKAKRSEQRESADAPQMPAHSGSATPSPYAVVIRTRAKSDAIKKDKRQKKNVAAGNAAASAPLPPPPPPVTMEELVENVVREEKQAEQCRLLGEENVLFGVSSPDPAESTSAHESSWMHRWFQRSWRPLLGGYISAPSRTDSTRLLLFPQSAHPAVDFRDPTTPRLSPGKSLSDPQRVPYYFRGCVDLDVEKNNPAVGADEAVPSGPHHAPADTSQASPGLSYSVRAAKIMPAASNPHQRHNWADMVEVSVAARQSRTERRYAPEREKVQRVTLLEDSAVVKVSRGNPRYSASFTAAHAAVPSSGVRHQHEASRDFPPLKKGEKTRGQLSSTTAAEADCIDRLQLQDDYDSSVQHFALPTFWQRLVHPSLKRSEYSGASETGTGTQMLDAVPRGQYRVRWSGGPGVEVCRAGSRAQSQKEASPLSLFTVFGKLWTESWLEVPLPWRLALKLRTQSAVVMPLEHSKPLGLPMVSDTTATTTAYAPPSMGGNAEEGRDQSPLREHPYFWATQGPRWDAALVRGFKNDYSGMHHARRWYSILSAELTLNGSAEKGSGKSSAPTSLTAFVNACMVDSVKAYPRASVGFSFTSKMPRIAITPFNEIIPHKFECSFSWFAAFKPNSSDAEGNGRGFNVELVSGVQPQQSAGSAAQVASAANGMPFLRASPVETFQHMKCGLTWKFDE